MDNLLSTFVVYQKDETIDEIAEWTEKGLYLIHEIKLSRWDSLDFVEWLVEQVTEDLRMIG